MHRHPEIIETALVECRMALEKIQSALHSEPAERRRIDDFYKVSDHRNTAARAALRKLYRCNSDHPKYRQGEIKGLYVFAWEQPDGSVTPFYVGISRTIIRRLRQHVFGSSDNTATLAFLMTRELKKAGSAKTTRNSCPVFKEHRESTQDKLRTARFAIAEIDDDFNLYLAEAYVAKALGTEYNSWRTH